MKNKILITAVPRSGTGYTSKLLTSCGIDVPHEVSLGKHGIVSWKGIIENLDCNIILHQTRNPLKVISSLTIIMPESWRYIYKNINMEMPKDLIERAMCAYYYWNKLIESKNPILRYKVEELDVILPYLFGLFVKEIPKVIPEISKDYNTKKQQRRKCVDIGIMKDINSKLTSLIIGMANSYGYFIK